MKFVRKDIDIDKAFKVACSKNGIKLDKTDANKRPIIIIDENGHKISIEKETDIILKTISTEKRDQRTNKVVLKKISPKTKRIKHPLESEKTEGKRVGVAYKMSKPRNKKIKIGK